jgi:Flp pilus assembly pilin Flp
VLEKSTGGPLESGGYRFTITEYVECSRVSPVHTLRDGFNKCPGASLGGNLVKRFFQQLWSDECGQDIAEYAVMLAVILVIVVGTIRLIGSNANNVFSSVGSAIQ